jgi:uncharacterized protein
MLPCPSERFILQHVALNVDGHITSAISYYKRAADLGDKRAAQRLKSNPNAPIHQPGNLGSVLHRDSGDSTQGPKGAKDNGCVIM